MGNDIGRTADVTGPAARSGEAAAAAGWWARMAGGGAPPPRVALADIATASAGGFLAIATVGGVASLSGAPLMLGSFGASCVILFVLPDTPFAQPRNVVGGHVISSAVGLAVLALFGATWWAAAIAVAVAIAAMLATRTLHPPAGSNPVIVILSQPAWSFLIAPTLVGAVLLVVVALLFQAGIRRRRWPSWWW